MEGNKHFMGENLTREWRNEGRPDELWDALVLFQTDQTAGLEKLFQLSKLNSGLAPFYIAEYIINNNRKDALGIGSAMEWLSQSFSRGSVEGGYMLAKIHQSQGNFAEAFEILLKLGQRSFAPAYFSLGHFYLEGRGVSMSVEAALESFRKGARLGHLHSRHWVSFIHRKKLPGFFNKIKGVCKLIMLAPLFTYYHLARRHSDRLRT